MSQSQGSMNNKKKSKQNKRRTKKTTNVKKPNKFLLPKLRGKIRMAVKLHVRHEEGDGDVAVAPRGEDEDVGYWGGGGGSFIPFRM